MLIGGLFVGTMLAFVYLKISGSVQVDLPHMKFKNPNYEDPQMEILD